MTPSQQAKQAGLKSLAELSNLVHVPVRTLQDWHKGYPDRFAAMCKLGAAECHSQELEEFIRRYRYRYKGDDHEAMQDHIDRLLGDD